MSNIDWNEVVRVCPEYAGEVFEHFAGISLCSDPIPTTELAIAVARNAKRFDRLNQSSARERLKAFAHELDAICDLDSRFKPSRNELRRNHADRARYRLKKENDRKTA